MIWAAKRLSPFIFSPLAPLPTKESPGLFWQTPSACATRCETLFLPNVRVQLRPARYCARASRRVKYSG